MMNSRRIMSDMGACSPRFVRTKAMAVRLVRRALRVSRSGRQVLGQHLKCSESRRERPLRRVAVVKGCWNGAGARTGLTLEVTHCGRARVPLSDRSHTTAGPACYALIGGSLARG